VRGLEADLRKAVDAFAQDGGEANLASCRRIRTMLEEAAASLEKELGGELEEKLVLARRTFEKQPDGTLREKKESLSLREQYDAQVDALRKAGLLIEMERLPGQALPPEKYLGIMGVDGKPYRLPSYEDILDKMNADPEKQELLAKKAEQGFTRLQITPFALPLTQMIEAYKQAILRAHKEGRLHDTRGEAGKGFDDLNQDTPVGAWDVYTKDGGADKSGALVYRPKSFDRDPARHQGRTKAEILTAKPTDPAALSFPGFSVLLLEENLTIPRTEEKDVRGNRPRIVTNKEIKQYLEDLEAARAAKDSPYHGEEGLTPEDWLTLAVASLESGEGQIDNYENGMDAICYAIGAWFPAGGNVPDAGWYRGSRQAYLYRYGPTNRDGSSGVRSAARV